MEFGFIIGFVIIFLLLIAVVSFAWKTDYATFKGKMGEMDISYRLALLPKDNYIVLNDLFFKFGDYTSQIDHLVISVFGIFASLKALLYASSVSNTFGIYSIFHLRLNAVSKVKTF